MPFVSSREIRVFISSLSSLRSRSRVEKILAVLKKAVTKKRGWHTRTGWQPSPVDGGDKVLRTNEDVSTRAKWKEVSHTVEELALLAKDKKNTWAKKLQRQYEKRIGSLYHGRCIGLRGKNR